jgi:hypothetical protein
MMDTDIAWCAGFFDGEGHVSYHRGYPSRKSGKVSPQLYANVAQNSDNLEVLEFFQSVIGFGKLKGPYVTGNGNNRHVITYGVDEVLQLFIMLKPYLKSKKTADFQRALMLYWAHNPDPTDEDYARLRKWESKKM